jgi:Domain of unknown function (DUF4279)
MRTETPYDDDYGTCLETHAWLRVMSEHLDPDIVTTRLQIQPTRTQRKGDLPRPGSKHPFKHAGWFLESETHVHSRDARRHIDWILQRIHNRSAAIAELQAEGHLVDICVRWDSTGQGGPMLSPSQMGALSEAGIELWFDIYFAGNDNAV